MRTDLEPSPTRRSLFLAAPAAIAAGALPAIATPSAAPPYYLPPHALELRKLGAEWSALITHEMDIEASEGEPGHPAYLAAIARSEAMTTHLQGLAEAQWEKPVTSVADLVVLAEIARIADRTGGPGMIPYSSCSDWTQTALVALVNGVLELSGDYMGSIDDDDESDADNVLASRSEIDLAPHVSLSPAHVAATRKLIDAMGGIEAVADRFGLTTDRVEGWLRTGVQSSCALPIFLATEHLGRDFVLDTLGFSEQGSV